YWTDFDNFQLLGEGIYRTDLELQHCKTVLNQHFESSHKNDPLFVCWAPIAPHLPGFEQKMVPDRLNDWGNEISIDQFSNFQSEPHIDGSHPAMQLEPLDSDEQKELQQTIIRRARALKVLDENLAELQNEFKRLGQLENTIFVITSDHGFSLGAHRHIGKRLPYQRVTRVPFIVCGPGVAEGTDCKQLLANIDIAPTLVEIAGGSLSVPIDGRSFFPLLSTPDQPLPFERSGILIENWESESTRFEKIPAAYSSIRFPDAVYTEWAGGKREYFDLTKDPDQEVNQYHSLDESQQQNLKAKMQGIRNVARAPFFPNSISIESDQPARYGSLKFSGYAEADQGVDKIEFVVKDRKTKEYFNGEYWQEQPASMNANLLIPGGLITRWNFHFQPIVQTLAPPKRNLSFSLVITDTAGQTNWQHDIHKTELDQDEPETWIDFPPKPDIFVTPKVIKGRAIDNHRVTKVMLCILDMENQKFWDGKKWINDNFRHELELKSTPEADVLFGEKIKSFKYRYTGDNPGHILFMVRAYDEKGFDQTVAVCHSWTKDHLKPKTNEQTSKQGKAITQK
ncbi:MAG: sulfatase-like hydrolase/transferase, partial [Planctomycetota bacterium]